MRLNINRDSNGTMINDGNVGGPTVAVPSAFPEDVGDACLNLRGSRVRRAQVGKDSSCAGGPESQWLWEVEGRVVARW